MLPTPRFFRAYKRITKRNPKLAADIAQVLHQLADDPFHIGLETHKLKGALAGVWACSAAYDLRILFEFVENKPEDDLLITIGTHDDIY